MDRIVRLGMETIVQNGASLVIKLPRQWLVDYDMKPETPIHSVTEKIGDNEYCIRVYREPQTWTTRGRVRIINNRPHMTVLQDDVRDMGLKKGDKLSIDVDLDGGVLLLRRAK